MEYPANYNTQKALCILKASVSEIQYKVHAHQIHENTLSTSDLQQRSQSGHVNKHYRITVKM